MAKDGKRLRLAAYYQGSDVQVDQEDRVLTGVSLMQAVEALGHGMMVDETTLDQVVALGNAQEKGVKCRFTHPGLSNDGLGKFLGRIRNLRRQDDKMIGDLHLSPLAFKSPTDGNLGDYADRLLHGADSGRRGQRRRLAKRGRRPPPGCRDLQRHLPCRACGFTKLRTGDKYRIRVNLNLIPAGTADFDLNRSTVVLVAF